MPPTRRAPSTCCATCSRRPKSSDRASSRPRSPRRPPRASPTSPRACATAATTPSESRTSSTGSCSACSPRTRACCPRASWAAYRSPRRATRTSSPRRSASSSRRCRDHGGLFGTEDVEWFNGGLFDSGEVLPLTGTEIQTIIEVSKLNWALIEPAIFGTLFERGLDPDQRAQLGAHYTGRDDIWKLVEPVIIRPLRREFAEMQARVTQLVLAGQADHQGDAEGPGPERRLRSVPRSAAARARARPRVRLRQLPDHRAVGTEGPRVRGHQLGLARPASDRCRFPRSAPRRSSASSSTPTPPSSPA